MKKNMTKKLLTVLLASLFVFTAGCAKPGDILDGDDVLYSDTTGKYLLARNSNEARIDDVKFESTVTVPKNYNNRVFYQIFVGSFSDSDGDGTGDLRGIINRFDYLNDGDDKSGLSLGVEGIWLSPIFKSPSYHKYDVEDYYTIDEKFGTMDDLKELVNLCHERNVKLILDMVINHTSSQNKMFFDFSSAHRHDAKDSEWYDFYTYSDTTVMGRTFYKISSDDEFYEGNFSSDMPELNFDNEAVRDYVLDVSKYYLTDIGVDGFRFDAAKYIYYGEETKNVEFWQWYMDELKKIKPDIYTVAEVWDSDSLTQKYAPAINCFDFTMAQTDGMIANTAKKGDVNKYVSYVDSYIDTISAVNDDARICPFIANHDMDRAAGYMTYSNFFAQVGANLYILGPGSPFIYYGEEIGMKGSRGSANTDANRRLAMLWGDGDTVRNPAGSDFDESKQVNGTVKDQENNGDSLMNYYKRLIMIRKANPEIALGDYTALDFKDTKIGGFVSTYEGSSVCVIHNTTSSTGTVDLSTVTDIGFNEINATAGFGSATLDGSILTIDEQTSVVLRCK